MIVELVLFCVVLFILYQYFNDNSKRHLMPPGPWEFPFFGNTMVRYQKDAEECQRKYGDIFMTKLGSKRFVFLTDFKITKEVMSRPEFADRPNLKVFRSTQLEMETGTLLGVFLSNGSLWQRNRRFLLRHLRDRGMGKSYIEDAIQFEAKNFVENLQSFALDEEPHRIPFTLNLSVLNVIWQLIASHRYDFANEEIQKFMTTFHTVQKELMKGAIVDYFPQIEKIVPASVLNKVFNINMFIDSVQHFNSILKPFIEEHKKSLDEDNPVDIIDVYLLAMKNQTSEDPERFTEDDLLRNCYDMYVAGSDTISNTIHWVILYLAKFQDVQKKLQEQIDQHVPEDQLPGLEHRAKLSYLDAIINEVSRHCSFTSFGLFRSASEDTTIKGYFIPKDTIVVPVACFSQNDPRYWKNPEQFNPGRFIGEAGEFCPPLDGYQPFGLGRRQCVGEPLAKMELFFFIGALFQSIHFEAPPEQDIDISPVQIPFRNKPNKQQMFIMKSRKIVV